jgi:hypothetical protein
MKNNSSRKKPCLIRHFNAWRTSEEHPPAALIAHHPTQINTCVRRAPIMDQIHCMDIITARHPARSNWFQHAPNFPHEWLSCAAKRRRSCLEDDVGRQRSLVLLCVENCGHLSHTAFRHEYAPVKGLTPCRRKKPEYRADYEDLPLLELPGRDFFAQRRDCATLASKVLCLLTSDGSERQPDWP